MRGRLKGSSKGNFLREAKEAMLSGFAFFIFSIVRLKLVPWGFDLPSGYVFIFSVVRLKPKKYATIEGKGKAAGVSRLQPPLLTIFIVRRVERPHYIRR